MRQFFKYNFKVLISVMITTIIVGSISVYAASQYFAKDISFTPIEANKEKGFKATNVEEALNELYSDSGKYKREFIAFISGNTNNGNNYVNIQASSCDGTYIKYINDKIATERNGIITILKSGKIMACTTNKAHYAGINASKSKLYHNDKLIYDLVSNEIVRCDELDVNSGDIIDYRIASGNTFGVGSITLFMNN